MPRPLRQVGIETWRQRRGDEASFLTIMAIVGRSAFRRAASRMGMGLAGSVLFTGFQVWRTARRDYLRDPPGEDFPSAYRDAQNSLHLLVIGDSTAVAVGCQSKSQGYPSELARSLSKEFRVQLTVLGRSGLRVQSALREYAEEAVALEADVILVGVGANDAIHLTPYRLVEQRTGELLDVLSSSGAAIVVAEGPRFDAPAFPHPLRTIVDRRCGGVNRAIRRAAEVRGIPTVDLREAIGDAFAKFPRRYYSADMLHPGPDGYALWASALVDEVRRAARATAPAST